MSYEHMKQIFDGSLSVHDHISKYQEFLRSKTRMRMDELHEQMREEIKRQVIAHDQQDRKAREGRDL